MIGLNYVRLTNTFLELIGDHKYVSMETRFVLLQGKTKGEKAREMPRAHAENTLILEKASEWEGLCCKGGQIIYEC